MACSVLLRKPTGQRISKVRKQQKQIQFWQSYSYVNRKVWYLMYIPISILDICWLRLDFESFTLQGTGNTVETDGTNGGGKCLDSFSVSVCSNILPYDIENLLETDSNYIIFISSTSKRPTYSILMHSGMNPA